MIFDKQGLFSDAQAITASAASSNVIDLGTTGTPVGGAAALSRDMGRSMVPILIQVVEDFATLTSLKVAVQVDTVENFASPETVLESEAIPVADLVAGYIFNIDKLPRRTDQRYVRLYYTVAGSNATAGKVTAGVVTAQQQNP
jgi:hypothetical protein